MRKYSEVETISTPGYKTGFEVFDNFISDEGGLIPANLLVLTGTSGAGKTTLAKKFQQTMSGIKSVLFCKESYASSVKKQTLRIPMTHDNGFVADETDYPHFKDFMADIYEKEPKLVIVDSVQQAAKDYVKYDDMSLNAAMMKVLEELYTWKDKTGGFVILICQLNKDGQFNGPAGLIFDGDAHLHLERNPKTGNRTAETPGKNRMGECGMIHYEFTNCEENVKFYTEEQWNAKKSGVSFSDFIQGTINAYLTSCVNSKSVGYKEFYAELNKEYKKLGKQQISQMEMTLEAIRLIDSLVKKYDLV